MFLAKNNANIYILQDSYHSTAESLIHSTEKLLKGKNMLFNYHRSMVKVSSFPSTTMTFNSQKCEIQVIAKINKPNIKDSI